MDRREFLRTTAASAAIAALPKALRADNAPAVRAQLTLPSGSPGRLIANDFLGFSYETQQLVQPGFFSAQNTSLAGFFRALGTGVLRIGGNSSEFAFWSPGPKSSSAIAPSQAIGPDPGNKPKAFTATTPQSIRNLREFLDMVDWRGIYGLNLGKGNPSQVAKEAAFVSKALGDRLICFQIGNEADLYRENGLRLKNYGYTEFAREWGKFHDTVKARVPRARFAGPDTSGTGSWIEEFARQFGTEAMLLSTHYYAEGPARDPSMNIQRLLSPNPIWENAMPKIRHAMAESHLPYRLTETNSCYGGGKPGVSNTFASALWALDLMLQLASFGGSGINFHSGGYEWYAPVAGTLESGFVGRPEYYAMRLFSQLLGSRVIASHLNVAEANPLFVSYVMTSARGKSHVIVINKDAQKDMRLAIRGGSHSERVSIQRLIAPTLNDEQDTTLAAAPIGENGSWKPERMEQASIREGTAECFVPAGSAALLSWD